MSSLPQIKRFVGEEGDLGFKGTPPLGFKPRKTFRAKKMDIYRCFYTI